MIYQGPTITPDWFICTAVTSLHKGMIQIKSETSITCCLFAPLILSHFDWNCLEYFQERCCYLQVINLFIFFTADEIVHLVINCGQKMKTIFRYYFPPRFYNLQQVLIAVPLKFDFRVLEDIASCHVIIFLSPKLVLIPCLALKF